MLRSTMPRREEAIFTVNEFVNQHKIVLYRLFVYLSKIRFGDVDKSIAELEDQGSIGIISG
jgi:hypothetical protein